MKIMDYLYPHFCALCQQRCHSLYLCQACIDDLPRNSTCCSRCAVPMPVDSGGVCGECLKQPPPFECVHSPFVYAQPMRWLIAQFKFNHKLYLGEALGELFSNFIREQSRLTWPQAIVPVPLHPRRLRERGFNQAEVLARAVSRQLSLKTDAGVCCRSQYGEPQTRLAAKQRRLQVGKAFECSDIVKYQSIAIIDDVVTTGSTVAALTRELKRHGVERVQVWSLARAAKPGIEW